MSKPDTERELEMLRRVVAAGLEAKDAELSREFSARLRRDLKALQQGSDASRERIARALGLRTDKKEEDDE